MSSYHFIREGQPGSEFLTFVVPAADLISFANINRFNEDDEGVERALNYKHVRDLADYMLTPEASISEPMLGDLRGPWEINQESQMITRGDGAELMLDDGQHRTAALMLLKPEQQNLWQFKVTATVNTPYRQRITRFIQQTQRLRMDSQLILQLRDRGDIFATDLDKNTYWVAKELATRDDSPLRGILRLEERIPKKTPTGDDLAALREILNDPRPPAVMLREETLRIDVMRVIRDVRTALGGVRSVILHRELEQQYQAIALLLQTASTLWPEQWNNPRESFLRRSDGVAGLIQIFFRGKAFRQSLRIPHGVQKNQFQITLNPESFARVLGYAKEFPWGFRYYKTEGLKFPKPSDIAEGIDALIHQNMPQSDSAKKKGARAG